MIRYLYGDQLSAFPMLAATMFRDRAQQFSQRLKWDVSVDAEGFEKDEYDEMNPIYIICENQDGSHAGSMRFLPTTGPVMINDHFLDVMKGVALRSPLIWECTRFCTSPNLDPNMRIPAALTLAAATMARKFVLTHITAVFDARMVKIYRSLAWSPEILGTTGNGPDRISVGLWDSTTIPFNTLCKRANISERQIEFWYQQSFGAAMRVARRA